MAATEPIRMAISGHWGAELPQEYGNDFLESDGTMIRNRSSHIPTMIPHEAITVDEMERTLRIASNGKGSTKLKNTMAQNRGEYAPDCVCLLYTSPSPRD